MDGVGGHADDLGGLSDDGVETAVDADAPVAGPLLSVGTTPTSNPGCGPGNEAAHPPGRGETPRPPDW